MFYSVCVTRSYTNQCSLNFLAICSTPDCFSLGDLELFGGLSAKRRLNKTLLLSVYSLNAVKMLEKKSFLKGIGLDTLL